MAKEENQNITFDNFDKFQRKNFASRLTNIISTFYPFSDESYVLSLNAKFGSGKTTFLKMWKSYLETQNYKVIYINAWETDFDDEPLIPIISALLDNITTGEDVKKIQGALQGVLGAVALAGNSILDHATGINAKEIMGELESDLEGKEIKALGKKLYEEYSFKETAYKSLKIQLSQYVKNFENKPLVILVDELDRARPDYSVKFLEAIKHIFPVQGVCFVLAVDREQLEISVKQLYGNIDFENYYRRFVTREANLPEVRKISDYHSFIKNLANGFFDEKREKGVVFPFIWEDQECILQFISSVCRACDLTPREVKSFFRIFSQYMAISNQQLQSKRGKPNYIRASVILIAVSIKNPDLYKKIGSGDAKAKTIHEYITILNFDEEGLIDECYVVHIAMSFCLSTNEQELNEIANICMGYDTHNTQTQYHGDEDEDNFEDRRRETIHYLKRELENYALPQESGFRALYNSIEEWRSFIE